MLLLDDNCLTVTILILIDGFLQSFEVTDKFLANVVTILILIDGFLQYKITKTLSHCCESHNPYFNRWFSAIYNITSKKELETCHNPYFNRWFSAIKILIHYLLS